MIHVYFTTLNTMHNTVNEPYMASTTSSNQLSQLFLIIGSSVNSRIFLRLGRDRLKNIPNQQASIVR